MQPSLGAPGWGAPGVGFVLNCAQVLDPGSSHTAILSTLGLMLLPMHGCPAFSVGALNPAHHASATAAATKALMHASA